MISAPLSLPQRHRAARLLHELSRPTSAAVIAQLPTRPGTPMPIEVAMQASTLPTKQFWTTVGRLEALGVLRRKDDTLTLARDHLDQVAAGWVSDSPLHPLLATHPRLASFVHRGRLTQLPTDLDLLAELYEALADLFIAGETLTEADLNSRIVAVHDDPAEVRRALVDRGLLHRQPGSEIYRRPVEKE